jgi:hypothetical protein
VLPPKLESALAHIERSSQDVTDALRGEEPEVLEASSAALRETLIAINQLVKELSPADRANAQFLLRLKRQARTVAALRETLIRRMVAVDRALGTLVPAATQASTYGAASARARPYGSATRQTGAFKTLVA